MYKNFLCVSVSPWLIVSVISRPLRVCQRLSLADFTLPELGEQIEGGDVLRVLVKAGDAIAKEQPVLELETDKATIEVPSSVAGTVKDIKVKAGDKVKVGQAIFSYDGGAGGAGADVAPKAAAKAEAPAKAGRQARRRRRPKRRQRRRSQPGPGRRRSKTTRKGSPTSRCRIGQPSLTRRA